MSQIPEIRGDGEHDDSAGIAAALAGKPFVALNGCAEIVDGALVLHPSELRLAIPVVVPERS